MNLRSNENYRYILKALQGVLVLHHSTCTGRTISDDLHYRFLGPDYITKHSIKHIPGSPFTTFHKTNATLCYAILWPVTQTNPATIEPPLPISNDSAIPPAPSPIPATTPPPHLPPHLQEQLDILQSNPPPAG